MVMEIVSRAYYIVGAGKPRPYGFIKLKQKFRMTVFLFIEKIAGINIFIYFCRYEQFKAK